MQIDWFTVAFQAVNFLILLYLLRRFLYQPVMTAMARREAGIARQLKDAESREKAAAQEATRYREKTEALARDRDALLNAVLNEVNERRTTMLEDARQEINAIRVNWEQEVERQRLEFFRLFKSQAAAALTRVARRMLADMADVELEQQLIRTFTKQLEALEADLLQVVRKSARKAGEIRVTTSFDADPEIRSKIRHAIQHALLDDKETKVDFLHSKSLLCGIEVTTDGHTLGWSVDSYLQTLEQEMAQVLTQQTVPQESGRA